jgi:hypothetical protein
MTDRRSYRHLDRGPQRYVGAELAVTQAASGKQAHVTIADGTQQQFTGKQV